MLRSGGFSASKEVSAAITRGVSMELMDALMVALGSRFESGRNIAHKNEPALSFLCHLKKGPLEIRAPS